MNENMLAPFLQQLPQDVNPVSREGVMLIQQMLENAPEISEGWEEHFPLTHRFADGVYAREMLLPAGSIIVGKIHRYGHLNILTKGKCIVLTEFGVERLEAPCTFVSKPGTKRVVGTIEDTIWTTLHGVSPDEVDDLEKIEDRIICKTFAEFDALLQLENKP